MVINVLLLGPALRIAERPSVVLQLDSERVTCRAVKEALCSAEPRLKDFLADARLAVNRQLTGEDHLVCPGDEVALIGMVSGG